jgi:hypothetical protein
VLDQLGNVLHRAKVSNSDRSKLDNLVARQQFLLDGNQVRMVAVLLAVGKQSSCPVELTAVAAGEAGLTTSTARNAALGGLAGFVTWSI